MRILYVTTISITMGFFPEHFKMLLEAGHTVELACKNESPVPESVVALGLKVHNIPFSRSPLSKDNLAAVKELKKLLENENYDIVHTHTPNASACVRLACRKLRNKGLKVFYTAHGFHFYKGAPLKNWLIYYPVEWLCAHWTDKLITINQEDYALAQKRMHAKEVVYVPGVGIDLSKFNGTVPDRNEKRKELGIQEDATLLISVGELNDNKNHETVIKAVKGMDVYYIIAGVGDKKEHLQNIIDEQGMTDRIKLLGFRTDVKELYSVSDVFVFPSFREGLSVSLMEAMASGLPCVVSRIRGNVDLIDENGGALFDPHNIDDCKHALDKILSLRKNELTVKGKANVAKIKLFANDTVVEQMRVQYLRNGAVE